MREAHNALAEAHEQLNEKVESIVGETFVGLIDESMLNEELAEKLNNKADQTALDAAKSENEAAHHRIPDHNHSKVARLSQALIMEAAKITQK